MARDKVCVVIGAGDATGGAIARRFAREGYAREYLCINGMWQDHLLYARLKGAPAS